MRIIVACLIIGFVFLSGCYYDTKENLYPSIDCTDSVNVTFSTKVAPILTSYCTSCHNVSNPRGNINLDNYDGVKVVVDNGKLMGSITHNGQASPMPQNGGKLDDCKIAAFSKWINAGALKN